MASLEFGIARALARPVELKAAAATAMNQPDKPVSARGARPQLFGEPKGGKSRQPDFGPSILATIDGSPRRDTRPRDAVSVKRVVLMSALALGVVAVYFAVKLGTMPEPAAAAVVAVVADEPAAAPVAAPEPVVGMPVAAASAVTGVASIENVVAPQPAAAPAAASSAEPAATSVAASLNNIQQTLARSDAAEPPKAAKPAPPAKVAASTRHAAPARAAAQTAKPAAKTGTDNDTDLLAAMLPHIKRRTPAPTSPAYEKRCGQLVGDAALGCRAKFCTGREGVDVACPVSGAR